MHQPKPSQNTNASRDTPIPPASHQFARLFVFELHVPSQTTRDNRHACAHI
ncbi:hypothetical protein M405DRAFT_829444 [Rhizopogon salebrosus TDB-379]|nr:hypothetical protein M405DRAFT_829444 [Rhizopogon salebrosus TDB-379]